MNDWMIDLIIVCYFYWVGTTFLFKKLWILTNQQTDEHDLLQRCEDASKNNVAGYTATDIAYGWAETVIEDLGRGIDVGNCP